MNSIQNYRPTTDRSPLQPLSPISPQTRRVLTLGERQGWNCSLLGRAPLPQEPVHLENWLIVPASQDSSEIPLRTYQRIQTLFESGIRPKGFVMVHEAPRLLAKPKNDPAHHPQSTAASFHKNAEPTATTLQAVTSLASKALLGSCMLLFGTLFLGLALLDPIVVAVMDDGCWVEIDRWSTTV